MGKKTAAELRAENKILRERGVADAIVKVFTYAMKYGSMVAIVYFIHLTVGTLAGKVTHADISVNADLKASGEMSIDSNSKETISVEGICWIPAGLGLLLGIGGIFYGRQQATLRRQIIETFSPYKEQSEMQLDPKRSSSKLTSRGETRPEDA